jgi:PAS domain S-box-containing protein
MTYPFHLVDIQLGSLNEAYCLVSTDSPENRIIHVNQFWTAMTGYNPEEAVGSPWSLLITRHGTNASTLNAAISSGQTASMCVVSYKKNGMHFCNHLVILPIGRLHNNGGVLSLACLMMREIPYVPGLHACLVHTGTDSVVAFFEAVVVFFWGSFTQCGHVFYACARCDVNGCFRI